MFCKLLIEVIYRRQSSSFFFFSPFSFRGDVWDAWAYLFIVLSQNVIPTVRQDVQSCQIFRHPLMTTADEQKPVNFGYRFRFEKRRSIPKTGNVTPMIPNGQHNSQSYHSERWVHERVFLRAFHALRLPFQIQKKYLIPIPMPMQLCLYNLIILSK